VPIGFLQGAGGISDQIQELMTLAEPLPVDATVLFNDSADELIKEMTTHLDSENRKYRDLYR
jgi:hypothetical protein